MDTAAAAGARAGAGAGTLLLTDGLRAAAPEQLDDLREWKMMIEEMRLQRSADKIEYQLKHDGGIWAFDTLGVGHLISAEEMLRIDMTQSYHALKDEMRALKRRHAFNKKVREAKHKAELKAVNVAAWDATARAKARFHAKIKETKDECARDIDLVKQHYGVDQFKALGDSFTDLIIKNEKNAKALLDAMSTEMSRKVQNAKVLRDENKALKRKIDDKHNALCEFFKKPRRA